MKTLALGPFLGINNRLPDFALHKPKEGDFLRNAVNVDCTDAGSLKLRASPERVQALTAPHSLFGDLLVIDSIMYRFTTDPYSQTLAKVLTSNEPMSWLKLNDDIYYSNGTDIGRIDALGNVFPIGMPTPASPPVTSVAGGLSAGYYQVAVAYARYAGGTAVENLLEEGGVSSSTNHDLATIGGLRATLPGAVAGATHVNVYVSTQNGSVPMLHSVVPVGETYAELTTLATGREAAQRYEEPLPAGTRLFEFNGRLCSVSGNVLYYGLPYRHGYYLPVEGRIPLPKPIAVAVANQHGVYLATAITDDRDTDRTYFVAGDDLSGEDTALRDVLPYGAVPGTEFVLPNKENITVGWFGAKGFVLADSQGAVEPAMADNVDLVPPATGFSTVFEDEGNRRVVACGWCMNLSNYAATRYEGWGFTSLSGGYGTMVDGIYTLAGTAPVAWNADFGKLNFGSENLKHLPAIYAGHASDDCLLMDISIPNGGTYTYPARSYSEELAIHRFDTGRGLRANWFHPTLHSETCSKLVLASISFAPTESTRRI